MIAWLIGLGVPARFAKPLLIGAGVILLLLAVLAAVKLHDRRVIANNNAKVEAKTAKADRKADAHAAEQRRTDDARLANETSETQEAVNEARKTGADPRAAYYACVRAQQSARRAGKQPPKC